MIGHRAFGSLLLLLLGIAACAGGSGSGGFDISSENEAIELALSNEDCVDYKGLTICAAGTTDRTPDPTPDSTATPTAHGTPNPNHQTPTPTAAPSPIPSAPEASFNLDDINSALMPCVPVDVATCTITVRFSAVATTSNPAFFVSARTVTPQTAWRVTAISSTDQAPGAVRSFSVIVPLDLTARPSTGSFTVQLAVLLYDSPPPQVPTVVEELIDAGPDAAFVSGPITVQ